MKVDPAGLVAAAQRLTEALAAVAGADPVHPALGADPASLGAAKRLSTAGASLAASLAAQAAGLVATAEQLGVAATGYVATDEANAALIGSLGAAGGGGPLLVGAAPPAPPLPADVRAPLAPIPAASGEALARATHAGDPSAGQAFADSWSRVSTAAADAAATVRSVVDHLPDVLDSPHAAPAVNAHLLNYANGFEAAGQRAGALARQAGMHAAERVQAGQDIPAPAEFTAAQRRVEQIAVANARTGGAYAVPLAQAEGDQRALNAQAVAGYTAYHAATDTTTSGDPSSSADGPSDGSAAAEDPSSSAPSDPTTGATSSGGADSPAAASSSGTGELAGMLPSMIPTVLGAAGGLLGGLVSSVAAVPEALMQAGTQAASAATQGLSGVLAPKADSRLDTGDVGGAGSPGGGVDSGGASGGDGIGGGGGQTTPAAGGPLSAGVMPSTGAPPAAPAIPAGAGTQLGQGAGGGTPGVMPMGMPMGAMGGGPGSSGGGKAPESGSKKVVVPQVPHSEAVTGKVSADRLTAVSATAPPREPDPPSDTPERPAGSVVRRITTVRPSEES